MKHTHIITVFMLAILLVPKAFGMMPEPSVEQVEKDTKGFLADLKAYKKCRKTGCPADLMARLEQRAKYIGASAAALVGAAAVAGLTTLGVYRWRKSRKPAAAEEIPGEIPAEGPREMLAEAPEIEETPPPLPERDEPAPRAIETQAEQLYRENIEGARLSDYAQEVIWAAAQQDMNFFNTTSAEDIVKKLKSNQDVRQVLIIVRRIAKKVGNSGLNQAMQQVENAFNRGVKPGQQ